MLPLILAAVLTGQTPTYQVSPGFIVERAPEQAKAEPPAPPAEKIWHDPANQPNFQEVINRSNRRRNVTIIRAVREPVPIPYNRPTYSRSR